MLYDSQTHEMKASRGIEMTGKDKRAISGGVAGEPDMQRSLDDS